MSEQESKSAGPDFAAGVPASSLPDGEAVRGHVGEDPVIVVRKADQIYAIGASCSHYGGPLNEGLIVGDTVRCPWHHACFDLKSGQALRPPALNPVTRWKVERRGDQVVVKDRLPEPARPTPKGRQPGRVVIIGGGAAGGAAASKLRREGFGGSITMISADSNAPYDRPNCSKDYLAGHAQEEWMPLWSDGYYRDQQIEIQLGKRAASIDVRQKKVALEGGDSISYDALLLATGADPVRLTFPGSDLPHVFTLRTLADSRAIIAASNGKMRAVVLGASFIGLEVAWSLRERGLEVHVIAPEQVPMDRILGPDVGRHIQRLHEGHGVVFHLGRTAKAIDRQSVTVSDDSKLGADVVVMGVGVRPTVRLAEGAGLAVDNGVVVDEYLATNAPGIYAAGDIARWPDPHTGEKIRVEHWVVAQRQGQVAAENILGARRRFDSVPFFWSQHYDVKVAYVGHAQRWDRAAIAGDIEKGDFRVDYFKDGRRLAVATVGRDLQSLQAEAEMERALSRA
ncbi:MAG: FAD-dependent oxidoreductase [Chloroflexi bacterium]|nr:FAD-dependent oxidoreductase [Chloroflexota bacterium]